MSNFEFNGYQVKNIYIFNNGKIEALPSCYFHAQWQEKNEFFNKEITQTDDYIKIHVLEAKKVNANHVEANAKKRQSFYVVRPTEYRYDSPKIDLYLCADIIGEVEAITNKKEYNEGCISVLYDKIIYFKENLIEAHDSEHKAFKTFEEARREASADFIKEIGDFIEEIKNHKSKLAPQIDNSKRVAYFEQKQKEGFKYVGFCYRTIKKYVNALYCHNFVDHYEKSAEYLKAEKIAKIFKSVGYIDTSADTIIKLSKVLNISIKRGRK